MRLNLDNLEEIISCKALSDTIPSFMSSISVDFMHKLIDPILVFLIDLEIMYCLVNFSAVEIRYSDCAILTNTYQVTSILQVL